MSNTLTIVTCDPWAPTLVAHPNMNKRTPSTSKYVPFIQVWVGGENFISPLLYTNIFLDEPGAALAPRRPSPGVQRFKEDAHVKWGECRTFELSVSVQKFELNKKSKI